MKSYCQVSNRINKVSRLGILITVLTFVQVQVLAQVQLSGIELDSVPNAILLELLQDAKIKKARVSSYKRTPRRQVELMYDLILSDGKKKVKKRYHQLTHPVIDKFEKLSIKPKNEVLGLMELEIVQLLDRLGPDRITMMHIEPTSNYTFDIAPSSIVGKTKEFEKALASSPFVHRYFVPGVAEKAYHIEILKDSYSSGIDCDDLLTKRNEVQSLWNQRKSIYMINQEGIRDFKKIRIELLDQTKYTTSSIPLIAATLKLTSDWLLDVTSVTRPAVSVVNITEKKLSKLLKEHTLQTLNNTSSDIIDENLNVAWDNLVADLVPVTDNVKNLQENINNFQQLDDLRIEVRTAVQKIDLAISKHNKRLDRSGSAFQEVNEYLKMITRYLEDECGYEPASVLEEYLKQIYGEDEYQTRRSELISTFTSDGVTPYYSNLPKVYKNMSIGDYTVVSRELEVTYPNEFRRYKKLLGTKAEGEIEIDRMLEEAVLEVNRRVEAGKGIILEDFNNVSSYISRDFSGDLTTISKDLQITDLIFDMTTQDYLEKAQDQLQTTYYKNYSKLIQYSIEQLDDLSGIDAKRLTEILTEKGFDIGEAYLNEKVLNQYVIPKLEELIDVDITPAQANLAYQLITKDLGELIFPVSERYEKFQSDYIDKSLIALEQLENFESTIDFDQSELSFFRSSILKNFENPEALQNQLKSLKGSEEFKKKYGEDWDKMIDEAEEIADNLQTLQTVQEVSNGIAVGKAFLQAFDLGSEDLYEAADYAIAGLSIYAGVMTGRYDLAITSAMGMFSKPQESAETKLLKEVLKRLALIDRKLDEINNKLVKLDRKIDSLHIVEMRKLHLISNKIDSVYAQLDESLDWLLSSDLNHCEICLELDFDYSELTYGEIKRFYTGANSLQIEKCMEGVYSLLQQNWDNLERNFPPQLKISDQHTVTKIYLPALNFYRTRFGKDPAAYYSLIYNNNTVSEEVDNYKRWRNHLSAKNFSIDELAENVNNQVLNPILVAKLATAYLKYDVYVNFRIPGGEMMTFQEVVNNPPRSLEATTKTLNVLLKYLDVSIAQTSIITGNHSVRFLKGTIVGAASDVSKTSAYTTIRGNPYLQMNLAINHLHNYLENDFKKEKYASYINDESQKSFYVGSWFRLFREDLDDGTTVQKFEVKGQKNLKAVTFQFPYWENALTGEMIAHPSSLQLKKLRQKVFEKLVELEFSSKTATNEEVLYQFSINQNR